MTLLVETVTYSKRIIKQDVIINLFLIDVCKRTKIIVGYTIRTISVIIFDIPK